MRFKLHIVLISLLLLVSCGEYEKLLKSTDYDLKKAKAKEYYEGGQYVKATELFSQILPRYRATEEAEDLNWMNAQSFYGMKDYFTAGSYFKSYLDQYPYGKYAEEASFMAALCDYNIAPRPELDQDNTRTALEQFSVFITRYPSSSRVEECKRYIKVLQEKLVEKSYLSAKLYFEMKQYKSAIVALTNSLKEYSESKYREEMMFLKLSSLFMYAENSTASKQRERYQDTLDDYYSFMEEYPDSRFSREVTRIFEATSKFLKIGTAEPVTND